MLQLIVLLQQNYNSIRTAAGLEHYDAAFELEMLLHIIHVQHIKMRR
jgi:hypothetical protein